MGKENENMKLSTVGSTFEISLRILLILKEASVEALDERQISAIDFIAVYAADFGILDENLHGYGNYRFSEYPTRKSLVSTALKNLTLDGYVSFAPSESGFVYSIKDEGIELCRRLTDGYAREYVIAVQSVMRDFDIDDSDRLADMISRKTMKSLEEVAYE